MTLLSVVHDECSAALTDRLVTRGLVDVVTVGNTAAQKAWAGYPSAKTVRLVTEASVTSGERKLADVGEVLVWGLLSVPRWLSRAAPTAAWYQVTATCQGGIVVADPLQWCVRHGQTDFRLTLRRPGTDLAAPPVTVEVVVRLGGLDYLDGLDVVADDVVRALTAARSTEPQAADLAAAPDGAEPAESLPLDRLALRVDWSEPADRVTRLIRSGIGRTTPAWTYLKRFPVSVGAAEVVEAPPCELAAGTIVRRDATGVVVQTGDGMVRVSQVRDAVGVLPTKSLRPGTRFGIDPEEELRSLWRRVADLERTVQWISEQVLPPPQETSPAQVAHLPPDLT
ncbi:hypothetical protein ACFY1S_03500 [Micromonospora sp. NPDC000663]|uniref:hypothetical protein n=1 Tax=Micromonospora sp. NPDC000663 TaxID=3364218 RepID=UPI0036A509BD